MVSKLANIPLAPERSIKYIGMFLRIARRGWIFFSDSPCSRIGIRNNTSFQQHGNALCYLAAVSFYIS